MRGVELYGSGGEGTARNRTSIGYDAAASDTESIGNKGGAAKVMGWLGAGCATIGCANICGANGWATSGVRHGLGTIAGALPSIGALYEAGTTTCAGGGAATCARCCGEFNCAGAAGMNGSGSPG
jgi:hypothetical protein